MTPSEVAYSSGWSETRDARREPLLAGVSGGALGYRPRLQDAVDLQAKVVVVAACGVPLDDEDRFVGSVSTLLAASGLGSAPQIALGPILAK
jgi:hypothetical protein